MQKEKSKYLGNLHKLYEGSLSCYSTSMFYARFLCKTRATEKGIQKYLVSNPSFRHCMPSLTSQQFFPVSWFGFDPIDSGSTRD
jgi:hypothetical protein